MRWGRRADTGLRTRLAIPRGERMLASGTLADDGTPIAATDRALYLQGERLLWTMIDRAAWTDPGLEVILADGRELHVDLDDEGSVPQVVHAQIDASIVAAHQLDLGDGRGVLAVARRAEDGGVVWRLDAEAGIDLADPSVQRAADAGLAALRESLGI